MPDPLTEPARPQTVTKAPPPSALAFACCAFDGEGRGHDGPCAWTCNGCGGTALCPECAGSGGEDDVQLCELCEGSGRCIGGCENGVVIEDCGLVGRPEPDDVTVVAPRPITAIVPRGDLL